MQTSIGKAVSTGPPLNVDKLNVLKDSDAGIPESAIVWASAGFHPISVYGVDTEGNCTCSKGAACTSIGKHPAMPSGWQEGNFDWKSLPTKRSASGSNLGLRMGVQPGGERLLCLDDDGDLASLQNAHGSLPETLTFKTGGGGQHLIFAVPANVDFCNKVRVNALKVDVRCDRSFIVVAPSKHASGGSYSLAEVEPIAQLPSSYVNLLSETSSAPPPPNLADWALDGELKNQSKRILAYCQAKALEDRSIDGSNGSSALTRWAGAIFWKLGLSQAEGWPLLLEMNQIGASPSWSEKELTHAMESGLKPHDSRPGTRGHLLEEWKIADSQEQSQYRDSESETPKAVGDATESRSFTVTLRDDSAPLARGDHVELADLLIEHLGDVVFDEGAMYHYRADGLWHELRDDELKRACKQFAGLPVKAPTQNKPAATKALRLSYNDLVGISGAASATVARPSFFETPAQGVAFKNGFLAISTQGATEFRRHSRDNRIRWGQPFDYDGHQGRPVHWNAFLELLWPNDQESKDLLHEMLGYLLLDDTSLQKIFLLLGPPRAGKGVILRLLKQLVGGGYTGFKVNALDQQFGLSKLVGKTVAVDADVRRSTGGNKNEGAIVERLLGISGEDEQSIPVKFRSDVSVQLRTRLVLASNPPFGLRDPGSTLAGRFVILPFEHSFHGKEDPELGEQIARELPAIVALAVDGLKRLRKRGRFLEPASATEHREQIERTETPTLAFLREHCTFDSELSVNCDDLYRALRSWSRREGHTPPSGSAFADTLKQRKVSRFRGQLGGKRLPRVYRGLALHPESEQELTRDDAPRYGQGGAW